jgi:hypothetical protein
MSENVRVSRAKRREPEVTPPLPSAESEVAHAHDVPAPRAGAGYCVADIAITAASSRPAQRVADVAVAPVPFQAKLEVGQPGDPYEQEAESVAEQVMRMEGSKPAPGGTTARGGKGTRLLRKVLNHETPSDASSSVTEVTTTSGRELDSATRAFMEPRFGADFSKVQIHADSESGTAARSISARAYTVGSDIVFGVGQFAPESVEGRRLIAHELTHVVQQDASREPSSQQTRGIHDVDVAMPRARTPAEVVVQQRKGEIAIQRDPEGWSGPSYARHGPPGSTMDQRRTATASPAAYTAEYDNSCLEGAKKIVKGIETLYTIAADLEKRADSGSMLKANDKDLLALAKQVKDLAKGLQGMKEGFDTLRKKGFDFSKTNFSEEPELPKTLDLLKGSIDSLTQGIETNAALADFQANPSRKTANAWATQVTKQFSAAKGFLGAIKLPPGIGWIKDYWEGLLGAPAAYVGAFQELSNRRYDELDKEAGISDESKDLWDTASGKVKWKGGGPVQELVASAYTAPNGLALYQWLIAHDSLQGLDLQKNPPLALAKAVIIAGINDDKEVPASDKAKWTAWVGAFQPAAPATAAPATVPP